MTTQNWITLICAVLGSGGFTALITFVLTERAERRALARKKTARSEALVDAVMMLVLSDLQTRAKRIVSIERRTATETKQLMKLRTVYKALGGDGWADDLYESAMDQPLTETD